MKDWARMALDLKKKTTQERPPESEKPDSEGARPFDIRELEKLPMATDQDPPYRPWWVIDWT
jgi:hypothetical protein